jgi:hypothetical protein
LSTIQKRVSGEIDGEFVLFLIGIRLNRPWTLSWVPVFMAMPRMLRDLCRNPELGLMHYRVHFGFRNTMVVQYWRSFEQLTAYAKSGEAQHLPAWVSFNKAVGTNGDVGIWHETYKVSAGTYENIYVNMPAYGVGAAGRLHDSVGRRANAAARMGA